MAEGGPTWQSSDLGHTAHLAVDGIDDPSWYGYSCTHTAQQDAEPPVWAVDLRFMAEVYYVEILNRNAYACKLLSNE